MTLGTVCVTAGLIGLLSFVFLAVAIGTDYWYIIDVSNSRYNYGEDWEDLNSHSGLWRICEGSSRRAHVFKWRTWERHPSKKKQVIARTQRRKAHDNETENPMFLRKIAQCRGRKLQKNVLCDMWREVALARSLTQELQTSYPSAMRRQMMIKSRKMMIVMKRSSTRKGNRRVGLAESRHGLDGPNGRLPCRKNACITLIDPFGEESQNVPESQRQLLFMQKAFIILLPLSLVLLVLGSICGLVSSLANGLYMLLFTGSYFLVGGALTLAGISVYIAYSKAALAIAMRLYGHKLFDNVHIGFSWSMGLACLSCVLEVISGTLFLLAAKLVAVQHPEQSATT
uniref:transmembrane protein 235 n=1 Tax=Pristiophorus japonicus TaxID=55135 RepID=UPI00398EE61B